MTASGTGSTTARSPSLSASSNETTRTASPHCSRRAWSSGSAGRQPATTWWPRSTSRGTRCRPTKPSAPVTSTLMSRSGSSPLTKPLEIGINHHRDQLRESDTWSPAEFLPGLGWIGLEQIHFGRAHVFRIGRDMLAPIQPHVSKRRFHQLPYAVGLAGTYDVVLGTRALEHAPHGLDVISGEAPVAPGIEVAQSDLRGEPELYPGHTVGDLAGDELDSPSGRLVIEQNTADGVQVVRLPIVDRDPVAIDLGHAVGRPGIERRGLGLRRLGHSTEHLGGAGLIEFGRRMHQADRLEDPGYAERSELSGQNGLGPGGGHVGLRRQVVDLVRSGLLQHNGQGMLVQQVSGDYFDSVKQVLDAFVAVMAGSADDASDLVALRKQELRKVRSILAGDAGDERLRHRRATRYVVSWEWAR